MRIGSSSISQNRPSSRNNISKGIIPNQNKRFNQSLTDAFENLNAWNPLRGAWNTSGTVLTTSTDASNYPILSSFDLRSQNITATMSLTSAGPGVVFWLVDENNWWAGVTWYVTSSEQYITGTFTSCVPREFCYGIDANGKQWGCESCSTGYNYGTRTRYNFYLRLLSSVNGVVSSVTNVVLRSTCSVSTSWSPCTVASNDNINGIQISTSGDTITVRGRDDANNFYGTAISFTPSNPNRGFGSGIIYTPSSNYLLNSSVQNISIVGA